MEMRRPSIGHYVECQSGRRSGAISRGISQGSQFDSVYLSLIKYIRTTFSVRLCKVLWSDTLSLSLPRQ